MSPPPNLQNTPMPKSQGKFSETLAFLKPYLWPADRADLKLQVVFALLCMLLGKGVTVIIPFTYKWAVNALTPGAMPVHAGPPGFWTLMIAAPIIMVIAYNVARLFSNVFNQVRDAQFAAVGQHAVRGLANRTFAHLHHLSLRFHLQRRTGGLSRVMERGKSGIETIIRLTMMVGIPTLIEFILTSIILICQFNIWYVVVVAVTVVVYVWFSIVASNWRIAIRRDMNEADTDSMSKAIDSLLNFETVKYFNNEQQEADRYNVATAQYEKAAIKTYTSLAWLNLGQAHSCVIHLNKK